MACFERAPPRPPLVEVEEDAFLGLVSGGGVSVVGIDGVGVPLNAGSIRSSLMTAGDGAACCCFLSSSADISCFRRELIKSSPLRAVHKGRRKGWIRKSTTNLI